MAVAHENVGTTGGWTVRIYVSDVLAALEAALRRDDVATADRLAALIVGIERMRDVRDAWVDGIEERWRELRGRCHFPSEASVAIAVADLAAVPRQQPKTNTAPNQRDQENE